MYMKKEYHCPICGRELIKSEVESYSFQCLHRDENFTCSEVVIRIQTGDETMKQKRDAQKLMEVLAEIQVPFI